MLGSVLIGPSPIRGFKNGGELPEMMKPPRPLGKTHLRFGKKGGLEQPSGTLGEVPTSWNSPKQWEAIQIENLLAQVLSEGDSRPLAADHEKNMISRHKQVNSSQPIHTPSI